MTPAERRAAAALAAAELLPPTTDLLGAIRTPAGRAAAILRGMVPGSHGIPRLTILAPAGRVAMLTDAHLSTTVPADHWHRVGPTDPAAPAYHVRPTRRTIRGRKPGL